MKTFNTLFAALFVLTSASSALAFSSKKPAKPVLFVMTNQATMVVDGESKPTGMWLSEFTKPYFSVVDAGHKVVLASPKGGTPPIDPRSTASQSESEKKFNDRFFNDKDLQKAFKNTRVLSELKAKDYSGIIFPGGHGPMFDIAVDPTSQSFVSKIYESGGVVGALCHGPAALVNVKLSDGSHLVSGKKVTAFTDAEERAVNLDQAMPFMLETDLRAKGAEFVAAKDNFAAKVIQDGRVITGQNPASALEFGEKLTEVLKH